MKKLFLGVTVVLFSSTVLVTALPVSAQDNAGVGDASSMTCYTTWDNSGTTHFYTCQGCNEQIGSNLSDSGKCG